MILAELVERLGYAESENYLRDDSGAFDRIADYGHLFRQAVRDPCRLKGVYTLRQSETSAIPVVYVCDATSETQAKEVHRLIWNQDTVPFIVVNSPETVRVYPGFSRRAESHTSRAVVQVEEAFRKADIARIVDTLSAEAVDTGNVWQAWGRHIRPEYRVDWQLLGNLQKLDAWLQQSGGLNRRDSHALIGKYVYLQYLRDRDILSDKKLEKWGVEAKGVFGRTATRDGLVALLERLDDWLNGEVFPIDFGRRGAPRDEHIARVAATFYGDEPLGSDQWQLHLDFKAYDFSYIPIEVLSIVYEQFLHAPGKNGAQSRGRSAGAYYTPIPVVNLMLSELEERYPLTRGMRVFDPACGSGAFLVQAFRRLIEREFPPSQGHPRVQDLRELLEAHFVGLDTDEDACRVTKLSLILTLLDYVHPPDLEVDGRPGPRPRLPHLRGNIFCGNFFDDEGEWRRALASRKADWVVGNPPWKSLKAGRIRAEDAPVLSWMHAEKKHRPIGNRQMARAFAWRAAEHVSDNGELAFFLPAMTLFEDAAEGFRLEFFQKMTVHTIMNFSNMRWVISGRRFTAPAAAFFYRPRSQQDEAPGETGSIRTYFPLVANQEATRSTVDGRRNESWSIVINASEIRDISLESVSNGLGLPWKIAFWGSCLDAKLLRSLQRRFASIGEMERRGLLFISQGLELRCEDASEHLEPVSLPVNAKTIDMRVLKGMRNFFSMPCQAVVSLSKELTHARKGRVNIPLRVCQPPHVLVSAARNFAVYSADYLIVPPRQIGIVSPMDDRNLLKALALFLSSDFAFYYEFLMSTEFGVERGVSTLRTMRTLPAPLIDMSKKDLKMWARFHDDLTKATGETYKKGNLWRDDKSASVGAQGSVVDAEMMNQLNLLVYSALGLGPKERALIEDFVRVRCALNDGKPAKEAVGEPSRREMRSYGSYLRQELDAYIRGEMSNSHDIQIVYDDRSAMVFMRLAGDGMRKGQVTVLRADVPEAKALEKCRQQVRRQRSQWVYFDRNLRVYEPDGTYILKPMQKFQWTRTQARIDARDIVSESMVRRDNV